MAQINKPTDYFNTKLWTGNGSTQSITGIGFQPDFAWIKSRTQGSTGYVGHHFVFDSVRGATNYLRTSLTNAEGTAANSLTSFDSDGYSLGSLDNVNAPSDAFVGWNWLAGGTASSNTDGSITSSVSVSTTSGFSIVSYTGTGSAGTIGHGLGSTPKMMIVKCRSNADTWAGYHVDVGATKYMELDTTAAAQVSTQPWNDTEPTSSVFTVGNWSATNGSGRTYIAYCFAEKKGFSKAFSYTGNGSADGNFVYCGFRPAFVLIKCTSNATDWFINDNKRLGYNGGNYVLYPDLSSAEASSPQVDILSNGFKTRTVDAMINNSGYTYIGLAFAESPLVGTNNIPACAR